MKVIYEQLYSGKKNIRVSLDHMLELRKIKLSYVNSINKLVVKMQKLPYPNNDTSEVIRIHMLAEAQIQNKQCDEILKFERNLESQRRNLADSVRASAQLFDKLDKVLQKTNQAMTKTQNLDLSIPKNQLIKEKSLQDQSFKEQKLNDYSKLNFQPLYQYAVQQQLIRNQLTQFEDVCFHEFAKNVRDQLILSDEHLDKIKLQGESDLEERQHFLDNQKAIVIKNENIQSHGQPKEVPIFHEIIIKNETQDDTDMIGQEPVVVEEPNPLVLQCDQNNVGDLYPEQPIENEQVNTLVDSLKDEGQEVEQLPSQVEQQIHYSEQYENGNLVQHEIELEHIV